MFDVLSLKTFMFYSLQLNDSPQFIATDTIRLISFCYKAIIILFPFENHLLPLAIGSVINKVRGKYNLHGKKLSWELCLNSIFISIMY